MLAGKQYRPTSDVSECGVRSGSTLFVNHPAVLDTLTDIKKEWFKYLDYDSSDDKGLKCSNIRINTISVVPLREF